MQKLINEQVKTNCYSLEEFVEMFNAALNEDGEMEQNPIWNNYYLDEKDGVKILVKRPIVIIK